MPLDWERPFAYWDRLSLVENLVYHENSALDDYGVDRFSLGAGNGARLIGSDIAWFWPTSAEIDDDSNLSMRLIARACPSQRRETLFLDLTIRQHIPGASRLTSAIDR